MIRIKDLYFPFWGATNTSCRLYIEIGKKDLDKLVCTHTILVAIFLSILQKHLPIFFFGDIVSESLPLLMHSLCVSVRMQSFGRKWGVAAA